MKRAGVVLLAIAIFVGWLLIPAHAAPPTVTPSPGYDARLQEQRTNSARVYEPVAPVVKPVRRGGRSGPGALTIKLVVPAKAGPYAVFYRKEHGVRDFLNNAARLWVPAFAGRREKAGPATKS